MIPLGTWRSYTSTNPELLPSPEYVETSRISVLIEASESTDCSWTGSTMAASAERVGRWPSTMNELVGEVRPTSARSVGPERPPRTWLAASLSTLSRCDACPESDGPDRFALLPWLSWAST